jgi:hypothetical protein
MPATAKTGPPLSLLYLVSWIVPGAGHLWLGRTAKGLVFLLALPAMFAIGIAIDGRLFPFEWAEPLVALAAVADVATGVPYAVAHWLGVGAGSVRSATYEYGCSFIITSGLLNALVILDAHDIAVGRK